ncbi:uncharacterized protein TNCV_1545591 [Trichonephila clavipes]|nr:uncharacterized protein TNCV_1545591 [Trichonephila clavipes]
MQMTVQFGSIPPQFIGRTLWGWLEASHLTSSSTNHTRGLAARRLFRVPPCRKGTIRLQTSMSSPGFEPSPYSTAVSIANHYTDNLVALHFKYDQARRRFVEWAQNEIAVVPDFHKRILFSDEAHFWLNGYVNKQNCRIWNEPNPHVRVETPLHPEKLTVWCALWAGGILLQKR